MAGSGPLCWPEYPATVASNRAFLGIASGDCGAGKERRLEYAGMGVGELKDLPSAADLVKRLCSDAEAANRIRTHILPSYRGKYIHLSPS
jgi:hypothetical protein